VETAAWRYRVACALVALGGARVALGNIRLRGRVQVSGGMAPSAAAGRDEHVLIAVAAVVQRRASQLAGLPGMVSSSGSWRRSCPLAPLLST
jgi:hypothetical protein